jgi:hypothetical protein
VLLAALLAPEPRNGAASPPPHSHSFTLSPDLDIQGVTTALTLQHHNGRAEGVSTKAKRKRSSGRCTDAQASPACATAFGHIRD